MKIVYYILTLNIELIAILPFKVIYFLSDITAYLMMNVIRYRRDVVKTNLKKSFPDKNKKEINKIIRKFYHNFSDLFFETIKSTKMSIKCLNNRLKIENIDILYNYINNGKSIIVCLAHRGNWEWLNLVLSDIFNKNGYAIYQPLKNKFFDDYVKKIRGKYNANCLIPANQTTKFIYKNRKNPSLYFLLSDQSPAKSDVKYKATFLNQKTPVHLGIEKLSVIFDFPVFYLDLIRIKRGYYKAVITEICSEPSKSQPYEITNLHLKILEKSILQQPDNWLWTHKRWKYAES